MRRLDEDIQLARRLMIWVKRTAAKLISRDWRVAWHLQHPPRV